MELLTDYEKKFVGKQETQGPNRGPMLTKWEKEVLGGGYTGKAISWCGIFQFAMLMEFNKLSRKDLIVKLGLDGLFPESADSWLSTARKFGKIVDENKIPGLLKILSPEESVHLPVIGLWMKAIAPGRYSTTDAHHVFLLTSAHDSIMSTIEGNTTRNAVGIKSRDGDGTYQKTRKYSSKEFYFVQLPIELTQH